jgi:hypothetical protein
MLSVTSRSRKGIAILSAGAAALLLTGLGVFPASADNLAWNPNQSTAGGTNGNGTWNSTGTNWYDTTSSTGPVVWTNNDVAGFTTAGSGTYTVSMANGLTADGLTVGNSISSTSPAENNYTFQGAGSGSYTLTDSGVFAVKGGTVTIQNLTIDNTAYGATTNTNTPSLISEAYTATLDIGSGGYLEGQNIAAGLGAAPGVINVNSGGKLSEANRIQINYGAGQASGNEFNVSGGTVNMSGGIAFLTDSSLANSAGVMNVGAGGTGGTVTVSQISSGSLGSTGTGQTGTLNVDSGTVTATATPSITSGSTTATILVTTIVNLNGGVLAVHDITESLNKAPSGGTAIPNTTIVNFNGGTLQEYNASVGLIANPNSSTYTPTNLNVLNGGAVIDNNGFNVTIYNPLLQGTNANGSLSTGGLKVINSGTGGSLTLVGPSTYTGVTEITSGATLELSSHTDSSAQGGFSGLASIADTSSLQIDSGGTFMVINDGVGTQISVGGLNLQGGTIDLGFDGGSVQNLLVGSKAAVSGTNIINLSDLSNGKTAVPTGTYTLIADAAGGLTGTFEFSNGSDTGTLTVGSNTYTGTLNNSDTAETLTVSAVPEPTAVALLALGGLGLLIRRRKPAA